MLLLFFYQDLRTLGCFHLRGKKILGPELNQSSPEAQSHVSRMNTASLETLSIGCFRYKQLPRLRRKSWRPTSALRQGRYPISKTSRSWSLCSASTTHHLLQVPRWRGFFSKGGLTYGKLRTKLTDKHFEINTVLRSNK